jgi:hypothetical protein
MRVPFDPQKFRLSIAEMVQTLCPGGISLNLSRFDTKAKHHYPAIYNLDRDHFQITRDASFIREAHCGEFDYSPSRIFAVETYPALQYQRVPLPNEILRRVGKFIPRLWVLVTDHGEGTHHVISVYRGEPLWKIQERDGRDTAHFKSVKQLNEVLAKIQACEGFDLPAWERFLERYAKACAIDAAVVDTRGAVIH